VSLFKMLTSTRAKRPSRVAAKYPDPKPEAAQFDPSIHFLFAKIEHAERPQKVTMEQIGEVAASIDVPRANMLALFRQESGTKAFDQHADGMWRPLVRFELHKLSEFTAHMFADERPDLFKRTFNIKDSNASQEEHYRRMAEAISIIEGYFGAAPVWEATGWGFGQVQGFNFRHAGSGTVERFVERMGTSELEQLKAVAAFLENTGIRKDLADANWERFALHYNGRARAKQYALEIAQKYHVVTGRALA
jgi:N-acetylmuramidase